VIEPWIVVSPGLMVDASGPPAVAPHMGVRPYVRQLGGAGW
jgi:hypothetical protein